MPLHVYKFGGTSVGTTERINAVADRIRSSYERGDQIIVVVSAMSGETNRLQALGNEISQRPSSREIDVLLASGEQVSISLLALALIERGLQARSYLGWQVKVVTDENHSKARIESIDV